VISKGFFIYFCPNRQIIAGFVIKLSDSVLETTESLNKCKGAFNTHRNAYSDLVSRHTEMIDLPPSTEITATLSGKPSPKKEGTTKASENLADSAENAIAALQSDTGIASPSQDMEIDLTSALGKRRAEDNQKKPSGIHRENKNKKKARKKDGSNPFFALEDTQYKTL
jgi:hypothetical protein